MKKSGFIIFYALLVLSCEEELPEAEITDFRPVIVRWSGPYFVDFGCGFSVEIDSQFYKPINEEFFGPEFETSNDTIVEMRYVDLKRKVWAGCGWGPSSEEYGIEILEIR